MLRARSACTKLYAAKELNIEHIFIDSLMKCGIGTDDYNGQKIFVDRLCWAAKTHNVHIHLVHHMRKREKEGHIPDKFDVKGAGETVDLVDNLMIVHRNKTKEMAKEQGKEYDEASPDTIVVCAKQRHGEWEGRFGLYFDHGSQQLTAAPNKTIPWPGHNGWQLRTH